MDGKQLGIVDFREAMDLADQQSVDLVEVDPNSRPPVCILQDYGKFQYEQKKKEKSGKSKSVEVKEVWFSPFTEAHDLEVKVRAVKDFLKDGHQVRIVVRQKKNQKSLPGTDKKFLDSVIDAVGDSGKLDSRPKAEGRRLFARFSPKS